MKRQFVSIFFLLSMLSLISGKYSVYPQSSQFTWVGQAGGLTNDMGNAITQDASGYIFWTGIVTGTCTFFDTTIVAGFADIFLAKISDTGVLQWIQLMGGTGYDEGFGIKTDSQGNVIMVGVFSDSTSIGDTVLTAQSGRDLFIAKFSNNGNFQWALHGSGLLQDYALCVTVDGQDNILVGGYYESDLTLGNINWQNPGEHSFLAKIGPAGQVLWGWTNLNPLDGQSELLSVATDNQDNIIVSGYFDEQFTIGNDTLWCYSDDIYIIKFLPGGNILWNKQVGHDDSEYGGAVVCDEQQNIYVTAIFGDSITLGDSTFTAPDGGNDAFLAKISPIGNFIWSYHISGTHNEETYGISYNLYSGVAITGTFDNDILFGNTNFTGDGSYAALFSENGEYLNFAPTSGYNSDYGAAILIDDWDNCYFTGRFHYTCTFGDTSLISMGTADAFLAKAHFENASSIAPAIHAPVEYTLLQNYPNPFNPTTTIEFDLPQTSEASLKVFNILGEEITTLLSGSLLFGSYKYEWDASNLASGVYLYRLQAGDPSKNTGQSYVETRKMVLIK